MAHALILRFPEADEARLAGAARELGFAAAFADIPPHLTLARWEGGAPDALARAAAAVAAFGAVDRLELTGLGLFAGPRPFLWLAPAPTRGLIALQREIRAMLDRLPGPPVINPEDAGGTWTPHVTIAEGAETRQLGDLAGAAARVLPLAVRPDRLALMRYPPPETLALLPLAPAGDEGGSRGATANRRGR